MNELLSRFPPDGTCRTFTSELNHSNPCNGSATNSPIATVVVSTKNRRDDLRRALYSAFAQKSPVEVLVMDDGSTDESAAMVGCDFPHARLIRSEVSQGYIIQRNVAAKLATTPFLFSIDDDAEFSSPDVIERTIAEFDDPRVGAVAIPYIEPHKGNRLLQRGPSSDAIWVTDAFVGTAHAVRRDVFLQLGGYRESLVHQGEERDFCIRMLASGHVVRLGTAPPIIHYESPRRDFRRMDYYGRRNDILFAWHNVPAHRLSVHIAATALNGIRSAHAVGRYSSMAAGMFRGFLDCLRQWRDRAPVPVQAYRLSRYLRKSGPVSMNEIDAWFACSATLPAYGGALNGAVDARG